MLEKELQYKAIIIPSLREMARDAFLHRNDKNIVDRYKNAVALRQRTYRRLFNMLQAGEIDIFFFDRPGTFPGNFRRYLFTRSVKAEGKVQKSCLWYQASGAVPVSDSNRSTWEEFEHSGDFPDGVTIYYGAIAPRTEDMDK